MTQRLQAITGWLQAHAGSQPELGVNAIQVKSESRDETDLIRVSHGD
jgi:hypothetical protein